MVYPCTDRKDVTCVCFYLTQALVEVEKKEEGREDRNKKGKRKERDKKSQCQVTVRFLFSHKSRCDY